VDTKLNMSQQCAFTAKAANGILVLEHLSCEESLRAGTECSLIYVYKYLKGGCKEDRARHFSVAPRDRTRGGEHKLKHRRFCPSVRKHFFTVRVTEHSHKFPRNVEESPSLEILKSCLGTVLGNLL